MSKSLQSWDQGHKTQPEYCTLANRDQNKLRQMTCINGKPRVCHSDEKLKIRSLSKVGNEVRAAATVCICTLHNCICLWVHPVDAR